MAALGTVVLRGGEVGARGTDSAATPALSSVGDSELMSLVAEHDERALGELYDRFALDAYRLALRVLCRRELAEDAVQEAFLSIWRFAVKFESDRGSARNWILMVVHRRAVDLVRRNRHYCPQDDDRAPGPLAPSAADVTALDAERRTVQAALASLTEKHRAVLELAYYCGYTQEEIAARLAIPIGTVKSQTYEALRRLQQLLETTQLWSA